MLSISKADDIDPHQRAKDQFNQFLEENSVPLRRAFSNYISTMLDQVSDAQIYRWIEDKDLQGFLKFAADHIEQMSDTLPDTFVRAANNEIERLSQPGLFGTGKLTVGFDPGNQNAATLMEDSRLAFIKDFTARQRDAVQAAIEDALRAGKGPAAAAKQFRDAIGLTENQYRAVQSYQNLLENTSRAALDRAMRDARFDRTITRAIENDDVLSAKQIERMVGRYTENMRNLRAMTIARTETMRALNQGKQSAWEQIAEKLGIDPDRVERQWVATDDDRTRETHVDLNGQVVEGMDTPFESSSGEELMYPGDPEASAEETINCRCTMVVRFPPAPHQVAKAYNPDEPRGPDGKWTSGGGTVYAYHGTTEAAALKIQTEGIRVGKKQNFDGESITGEKGDLYRDSRGRSVYVANTEKAAKRFADHVIANKGDRRVNPVVFKLAIPKQDWKNFKADEDVRGAARTTKSIPAKWIVSAKIWHLKKSDSATTEAYMVVVIDT